VYGPCASVHAHLGQAIHIRSRGRAVILDHPALGIGHRHDFIALKERPGVLRDVGDRDLTFERLAMRKRFDRLYLRDSRLDAVKCLSPKIARLEDVGDRSKDTHDQSQD
jgi:hypothetical protein